MDLTGGDNEEERGADAQQSPQEEEARATRGKAKKPRKKRKKKKPEYEEEELKKITEDKVLGTADAASGLDEDELAEFTTINCDENTQKIPARVFVHTVDGVRYALTVSAGISSAPCRSFKMSHFPHTPPFLLLLFRVFPASSSAAACT